MGAMGAMEPRNFQKDAFGTHKISNSMYIGTIYLIDWHPWNSLVPIEWHLHSQIANVPSAVQIDVVPLERGEPSKPSDEF